MGIYRPKQGGETSARGASRRSRVDNSGERTGPLKNRPLRKTIREPLSKTKISRPKKSRALPTSITSKQALGGRGQPPSMNELEEGNLGP